MNFSQTVEWIDEVHIGDWFHQPKDLLFYPIRPEIYTALVRRQVWQGRRTDFFFSFCRSGVTQVCLHPSVHRDAWTIQSGPPEKLRGGPDWIVHVKGA